MKNVFIWIAVLLVVAVGAVWFVSRPDAGIGVVQDEAAPQTKVIAMNAQNESGMSGIAAFTDVGGSTLVVLDLAGAPAGVAQPAHIHTGSCADIGGVAYALEFPVNGASETTLDISLDALLGQLPLAVNVHKSPEEANVYVACGDLI